MTSRCRSGARRGGRRRGRFGRPVDTVLFYAGLALFGTMSLLWSLPAGLLNAVLPRRVGAPLGQGGIRGGFRIFIGAMRLLGLFDVDLRALDTLRGAGPLIIAANHPSLLDAVLIISRLPGRARVWAIDANGRHQMSLWAPVTSISPAGAICTMMSLCSPATRTERQPPSASTRVWLPSNATGRASHCTLPPLA